MSESSDRRVTLHPPGRGRVALGMLLALLALGVLVAPDVLLVVFAGLLFGVFFGGGGDWLARRLGLGRGWGVALFILLILLGLAAFFLGFAPQMAAQSERLSQELPEAFEQFRARLDRTPWGEELLDRATPSALMPDGGAATAVFATFGALGNLVIMLFIGLYVALDPRLYRRGIVALLAPDQRPAGAELVHEATATLQNWLAAQLSAMTVVGVLTWAGLWLIGVPLAPILGLIAALLAFVPNIGPIVAAVPAVLLGFAESPTTALLVAGVYLGVQTLESYAITPLLQQERVSLPPALIIAVQLLMGVQFGLLGLALATPLAALTLTLVREGYVRRYLEAR